MIKKFGKRIRIIADILVILSLILLIRTALEGRAIFNEHPQTVYEKVYSIDGSFDYPPDYYLKQEVRGRFDTYLWAGLLFIAVGIVGDYMEKGNKSLLLRTRAYIEKIELKED